MSLADIQSIKALKLANVLSSQSIDIKSFGAKCDGGSSQNGVIYSSSKIIDPFPPTRLPVQGQLITWVGQGSPVGGGITSVSWAGSGSYPVITTSSPHGLSNLQQVTISGVQGSTQLNGTWSITWLSTTTFSVRLNTDIFGSYVSGGSIYPTAIIFGYVGNPQISNGQLTFDVNNQNGTPVTLPSLNQGTGIYYFGSDDTVAWNAAIAKASAIGINSANSVRVKWSGVSMVSSQISVSGNVLIEGDYYDYTNPDGKGSSSTLPMRGSILRAHGNFTNASSSSVLQLGTVTGTNSGVAGSSTLFGVIDAANIVKNALIASGSRNFIERTYACNGVGHAMEWNGSNTIGIYPIAGQSNTGDGLYLSGDDCKWYGGYIRQCQNAVRIGGGGDFSMGGGVHIFNGYNGGNEQPGCDIIIDCSIGNVSKIRLSDIVYDGVIGSHIRIAPSSGKTVSQVLIDGGLFFQPQSLTDQAFAIVQLDTTQSGTTISDVLVQGYMANAPSGTNRYKSILDSNGAGTFSRINLGLGNANNCAKHYTGSRPVAIASGSIIYNGTGNQYSERRGTASYTGDGTNTQFSAQHFLSTTPNDAEISAMTVASAGAWVTFDTTNIYFNFSTPPANGALLKFSFRASI